MSLVDSIVSKANTGLSSLGKNNPVKVENGYLNSDGSVTFNPKTIMNPNGDEYYNTGIVGPKNDLNTNTGINGEKSKFVDFLANDFEKNLRIDQGPLFHNGGINPNGMYTTKRGTGEGEGDEKTTYILKNDFVNGVLPNSNGTPNILFKKGDKIRGVITKKLMGKIVEGVEATPTVKDAYIETEMAFVPVLNLTDLSGMPLLDRSINMPTKMDYAKKIGLILLIVGGSIASLIFAYKKYPTATKWVVGIAVALFALIVGWFWLFFAWGGENNYEKYFAKYLGESARQKSLREEQERMMKMPSVQDVMNGSAKATLN